MIKRRAILIALATGLFTCAFVAGYRAHVLAEGAPTKQPLFYSGTLETGGAPASGEYTVTMTLHDAASGGNELCGVESKAMVESGRFRIDASDCQEAIADQPDTWIAVSFAGSDGVEHAIPGRSKVGAVPYALEADHAISASTPSGALATTIQQLSDRVNALESATGPARTSAFIAYKSSPQTIVDGPGQAVVFEDERLDLGDEYDKTSGKFTVKNPGLYEFSCTIAFDAESTVLGTWEVSIALNGWEHTYDGHYGDGVAATRSLTSVLQLNTGDVVTCTGLVSVASAQLNVTTSPTYNAFSGHRL
jgi:hypothetical protein